MAFVINCGEQDIEDDGICVSMQIHGDKNDTPASIFINIADNLLGVSEFIASCGYKFAQVGFDYDREGLDCQDYLSFTNFINLPENSKLKKIFDKYVKYEEDEAIVDDGVIRYLFILDNIKADMTEDDIVEFSKIFKAKGNNVQPN